MGVDLALEFIGLKETIEQAVGCIRTGGRVVVVGLGPEEVISPTHSNCPDRIIPSGFLWFDHIRDPKT